MHCKEVVQGGIRVFVANPLTLDWFEMLTYAQYAEFCETRRRVVEAYTARPVEAGA